MPYKPNVYWVEEWGPPVPKGASDTRKVRLAGYSKRAAEGAPHCVANEYIAAQLGQILRLPVPPGAVVHIDDGSKAWVNLTFTPGGEDLPDVDPRQVVDNLPDLAALLFVFDLLIANTDRHAGNLASLPPARLEVFDHSHALFRLEADACSYLRDIRELFVLDGNLGPRGGGARHCLLPFLRNAAAIQKQIAYVRQILRDEILSRVCFEAADLELVSPGAATCLYVCLRWRRDNLLSLVHHSRTALTLIEEADWENLLQL